MTAPAFRLVAQDASAEPESLICPGDLVRTGDNLYPHFEVIAISGERAWIRDVQYRSDHIGPISRYRKV